DLERRVLAGAARVLAVTDKVASTIREKHGIAAEPNYPGMDRISDVPFGRRGRRLIAVSFWDWGRRPEDYLRLVESLDDYTLLMVGNWRVKGAKERFLEEVRKRGMDGRVLLMEGVPEGELGKLYDSSMFAVRFGYGEYGLATMTIEAIQHTLPLIINDELGTADLVRQCGAGLVTRGVDLERIKEFIRNVDEATYDALQNNIRRLQAKYTWESHVRKLVV
ncbi:MAG: glycosyltransferase family 1 protein, partial [Conexivisphaera sp.]